MTKEGVLMEPCDHDQSCNLDAQIFKGIFVRNLRWTKAFKDFKIQSFLRYLIDKLGEQNEREKKAFMRFLETNAASLKNNSMCTPVSSNMSNVSNNCHIVYMDGSPSYPATGASVINLSQGAQACWKFVYQIYPPAIDTLVTGMGLAECMVSRPDTFTNTIIFSLQNGPQPAPKQLQAVQIRPHRKWHLHLLHTPRV